MKTACLIDLANNNITIEGGHEAKRLIIDFVVAGEEGQSYDFKDVNFGYQIQKNNDEIVEESWPIPGIKFGKLSPGIITSADIKLEVDTDYKLLVWYTRDIYRHSDTKLFNSGRPFKAYDSMVWNEETEEWEMLKPYPEDNENYYIWNEESLEWEIFKFEEESNEN
jgi:hypothetical protein